MDIQTRLRAGRPEFSSSQG